MRVLLALLFSLPSLLPAATPTESTSVDLKAGIDAEVVAQADRAVGLGSKLFLYDRMAWVASDIYRAELTQAGVSLPEAVVWAITEMENQSHLVAFVIDPQDEGGYVDGEVYFDGDSDPDRCIRGEDDQQAGSACRGIHVARGVRPPTPEERAWANAKYSMLSDPQLRLCTDALPNFSLILDGGQTLGYVLSATTDPKTVVVAGHTRYSLSADGTEILDRERLFQRCKIATRDPKKKPLALGTISRSDPLFNEGHVLLMLEQRVPVHVRGRLGHRVAIDRDDGAVRWRVLD